MSNFSGCQGTHSFTINISHQPTPSASSAQQTITITPQQSGQCALGTNGVFNYGTNNAAAKQEQVKVDSGSQASTSSSLPIALNTSSTSCPAKPAAQNTLGQDLLNTGIGGKSLLSANAHEKKIDESFKKADEYSQKAHDLELEKAKLGKTISQDLRSGKYNNNSPEILKSRAKFAQLEKDIKTYSEKATLANTAASTAIANRNNALDGVSRESSQTGAPTNPVMQMLNQLIAWLFGTNNKENLPLLETAMGGGNRLAAQEYDKDISKAQKRLEDYEKKLSETQDKKEELGNWISDQIRNKGMSENHLDILEAREKWDALSKREQYLNERVTVANEDIKTFEAKKDTALNANVASSAGNNVQPNGFNRGVDFQNPFGGAYNNVDVNGFLASRKFNPDDFRL